MGDNAGATQEAFEIMADTAVMTNERLQASAENLKIAVGESLSPMLDRLKKIGIDILEWFTKIAEESPELVEVIAGATTGIAVMAATATTAATALAILRLAFGDAVGAAQVFAAVGIAAAAGALGAMAISAENATDSTREIVTACRELEGAREETERLAASHAENANHARELADRYNELASKAHLTDEEFEELNRITTELNTTVSGLALPYRESADAIGEYTDAIRQNIEALIEEQVYEDNMEDLKKKYSDLTQAQSLLEESTNALSEAQKKQSESYEQLMNATDEADIYTLTNAYNEATVAVEELSDAQKIAEEEAKAANDAYNEQLSLVEQDTKKVQENVESKQAAQDAEKALEDSWKAASDAISDQIGLFDEWNGKSKLTFEQMLKNWQDQTTGVNQYTDDIAYLKTVSEQDVNPALRNLVNTFADLDVNHSGEIHALVEELKNMGDLSDTSNESVKNLTTTWQDHIDALKNAEGVYASIQQEEKGYVESSTELFTLFYRDSKTDRETFNKDMSDLSVQGIEDQQKAIEDNMYLIEDASQELMESSLAKAREAIDMPTTGGTSEKYRNLGQDIVNSIVDGFDGGDQTIGGALGNILQRADDNVDVSGVAARINEKLNDSLNREINR